MPVNQHGIYIYSPDDTVSTWEGLLNLGMNSVSNAVASLRADVVYKVATADAANNKRDALVASGLTPTPSNPFLMYLTGTGKFVTWDGSAWKMNGDAIQSWTTPPDGTLDPNTPGQGALLLGKSGSADKHHMEYGSSVVRVTSVSGHARTTLSLKNQYVGIATAIVSNGAPEIFRGTIGTHDRGFSQNPNGSYSSLPIACPGAPVGGLIRINYLVVGWLV